MKKSKPKTKTSRSRGASKNVEEYLAAVPEASLEAFTKLREVVRAALPADAVETISYRIPAFKHDGVLVWFAAFSNHCSLFPTAAVIESFKEELKGFSISKGTVHFPNDEPLPTGLIKKLVKARVAQKQGKRT